MLVKYNLPSDYEYCFSLSEAALFKNDLCHRLDDIYGDIQSNIADLQRDVIRELEQAVKYK